MMEDCAGAVIGAARVVAGGPRPDFDADPEERRRRVLVGLDRALAATSPRLTRQPTPWRSVAIHGAVVALWLLLLARAFGTGTVFA
jgi:hypothetical protein